MILERRRTNNTWLIFKECLPQAQDWSIIMSSKSDKGDRMPPRISKELLIKLKHKYINRQELRDRCGVRSKECLLLIKKDQVREHWNKQGVQKFFGPDGMHSQMQRELANVLARQLQAVFGRSWGSGKNSEVWKKTNVTPVCKMAKKEDLENL